MDACAKPDCQGACFGLRAAAPRDEAAVRALMEWGGMGLAPDWLDATVAVDDDDQLVGYLRVQQTDLGPHVAPVAVVPSWQGRGVGRALIQDALERTQRLKLVARGEVAGFYRSIGCHEISFDEISDELEEDCRHCADREACGPVAFAIEKAGERPSRSAVDRGAASSALGCEGGLR